MNAYQENASLPEISARQMLSKVPEVTIFFWIIKIMATTIGETGADFLNVNMHWGLTDTSLFTAAVLAILLVVQLRARKYVPVLYWLVVLTISVVGTLITDNLHEQLGISNQATSIAFFLLLIATFAVWFWSERTLSIHSIYTARREAFYWLAILFTFALGTAAGDLTSETLKLGYWLSALMFAGMIGVVTAAHFRYKLHDVWAFWIAYVLTRPLGANIGDWLAHPAVNPTRPLHVGLGLGTVGTSEVFLASIVALVIYLTWSKVDQIQARAGEAHSRPLALEALPEQS